MPDSFINLKKKKKDHQLRGAFFNQLLCNFNQNS